VIEYSYVVNRDTGKSLTFQVVLYEGSNNIRFNYKHGAPAGDGLDIAGIENWDGSDGLRYTGLDEGDFDDGLSVLFYPDSGDNYYEPEPSPPVVIEPEIEKPVAEDPLQENDEQEQGELVSPEPGKLYFPLPETSGRVVVGLANSGEGEAVGELQAVGFDGLVLDGGSATVRIPSSGSLAVDIAKVFSGLTEDIAYVSFAGESDGRLSGYCRLVGDEGGTAAFPASSMPPAGTKELYLPRMMCGDGWTTEISLVYLGHESMFVYVKAQGKEIKKEVLNRSQSFRLVFGETYAGIKSARIVLSGNSPMVQTDDYMIVGSVVYRKNGRLMGAARIDYAQRSRLTMPYLVNGEGWWSSLSCYNPADDGSGGECEINTTARVEGRENGVPSDFIPLGEEESRDFWKFPSGSYALEIENPCGLTGIGFLGFKDDSLGCYSLPASPRESGLFAPVSISDGHWSGLVLYNPGPDAVTVTFYAYNAAGELLSGKVEKTIAAFQNLVDLPQTLFEGEVSQVSHIRYQADGGLYGLLVNFGQNEDGLNQVEILPALAE
jgi:hypothetical protein